jgi:hypothetical protein
MRVASSITFALAFVFVTHSSQAAITGQKLESFKRTWLHGKVSEVVRAPLTRDAPCGVTSWSRALTRGARVEIYRAGEKKRLRLIATGRDGRFDAGLLPHGSYEVWVHSPRLHSIRFSVVSEGESVARDEELLIRLCGSRASCEGDVIDLLPNYSPNRREPVPENRRPN